MVDQNKTQKFGVFSKESETNIPLKSIEFKLLIIDCISKFTISQVYSNSFPNSIEAQYVFPIDHQMAVTELVVETETCTIQGQIEPKEEAKEKYGDELSKGNAPFLMMYDHDTEDLLQLNLGNIQPNEQIKVVVSFVRRLQVEDNSWSIRIPTTYTPRYNASPQNLKPHNEQEFIFKVPYTVSLSGNITSSSPITRLTCFSHKLLIQKEENDCNASFSFELENEIPDRDIVIIYRTKQFNSPSVILQKSIQHDSTAALISFYPQFSNEDPVPTSNELDTDQNKRYENNEREDLLQGKAEYIFVLDCSGSMSGLRIQMAKEALSLFLKSLPVESLFNVILFGSNYECFFPESVTYNQENSQSALERVQNVEADLGGTEILNPLKEAFEWPLKAGVPKNIFLLTDGSVSNSKDVIKLIQENSRNSRVHSFGIGSGASSYLIKQSAIAGKGSSYFITEGENISHNVISALKVATKPVISNIQIEWPPNTKVLSQYPSHDNITNIYYKEPLIIYGILQEIENGSLKVTGINTATNLPISDSVNINSSTILEGDEIYKIGIRQLLLNCKLTSTLKEELSLKFGVMSEETAFIGVKKMKNSSSPIIPVKIPLQITYDASDSFMPHRAFYSISPSKFCNYSPPQEMNCIRKCSFPESYGCTVETYCMRKEMKCKRKSGCISSCSKKTKPKKNKIKSPKQKVKAEEAKIKKTPEKASKIDIYFEENKWDDLIKTQNYDGSFPLSQILTSFFSKTLEELQNLIPQDLTQDFNDESTLHLVWGTILSITVLEEKFRKSKESWILIAQKSKKWLQTQNVEILNYQENAKTLLK